MESSVSGATSIIYARDSGQSVPMYDGTSTSMIDMGGEVSQALTDTTKSPAAAVPNAIYDIVAWNDGSTKRISRTDYWKKSATVTVTIASPCVVSWTTPLLDGTPIVFTTTGALPTGLTAGTTYFVKSPSGTWPANSATFNVAATAGGAAINTSGSQSGTHTATAGDDIGTVAIGLGGNCERQIINGFLTNKNAITNGPAANRGTWLGTIRTNASGTLDYIFGGVASGGTAGSFGVWNAYNRRPVASSSSDATTSSYTYTSAAWRAAQNGTGMRCTWVQGLLVDSISAVYSTLGSNVASNNGATGIGVNSTTAYKGGTGFVNVAPATAMVASYAGPVAQTGLNFVAALEYCASGTFTIYPTGGGVPTYVGQSLNVSIFN
jgi:hypothetical protein